MPDRRCLPLTLCLLVAGTLCISNTHAARPDGKLKLEVVDETTDQPLPARIHLKNSRKRAVKTRGLGVAQHADHFYIDGEASLPLRRGTYTFDLDTGWEYRTRKGDFEIVRHADDTERITMHRFADLADEGWFAGDLDSSRSPVGFEIAKRAEGIAYAPTTVTRFHDSRWQSDKKTFGDAHIANTAARYESKWGELLFYKLDTQPELAKLIGRVASIESIQAAHDAGYYTIAADLTAWRLPIWLADDVLDAVMVIDRSSQLAGNLKSKQQGRSANKKLFPEPKGPGRWREAIYFHILNSGLRLPPVAGSGSGPTENPLGSNRVYVYSPDRKWSVEPWWDALTSGASVVTNGPLIRPVVFGKPPGFTFPLDSDGKFAAKIGLNLSTRQTVEYLELIQNGEPVLSVRLADWASAGGRLPPLEFAGPGWFAIRAVTTTQDRYQFALSAPYYVGNKPRISRRSCQFFLDWLEEYQQQIDAKAPDWQREEIALAKKFWQQRHQVATVD